MLIRLLLNLANLLRYLLETVLVLVVPVLKLCAQLATASPIAAPQDDAPACFLDDICGGCCEAIVAALCVCVYVCAC